MILKLAAIEDNRCITSAAKYSKKERKLSTKRLQFALTTTTTTNSDASDAAADAGGDEIMGGAS